MTEEVHLIIINSLDVIRKALKNKKQYFKLRLSYQSL